MEMNIKQAERLNLKISMGSNVVSPKKRLACILLFIISLNLAERIWNFAYSPDNMRETNLFAVNYGYFLVI